MKREERKEEMKNLTKVATLSLVLVSGMNQANLNAEEVNTDANKEKITEQHKEMIQAKTAAPVQATARSNSTALAKAKVYAGAPFYMSNQGIYKQLKYEGFSSSQAQYGADHCGANWNNNAYHTAQDYASKPFYMSNQGIYEQLKYEGFTSSQAHYGADHSGANWNNNAYETAKEYAQSPYNMSDKEIYGQLKYEGFTSSQAQYGVNKLHGIHWTTSKTYSKVTGKTHGANSTYTKNTYKDQVSNIGTKRTVHTDGTKGVYDANGHTKTWEHWYFNGDGKETSKSKTTYAYINGKEVVTKSEKWKNVTPGGKRVKSLWEKTTYYSNGKVKTRSTYTYYSGTNNDYKNVWNEFYSNGKPKLYKDTYYNTNGSKKEVRQSKFTTTGKKTHTVTKY